MFDRDDRQPKQPLLQYVESHNDDVTEVSPGKVLVLEQQLN